MRYVGGTVAALTLTVLLAGCGGGSNTKRDYIARADAICASALRDARSIPPPSFGQTVAQRQNGLAEYLTKLLPVVESEASQLRALRRPTEDADHRAALARYLGALTDVVGEYRELAAAATQRDAQGIASAEAALGTNPVSSLAVNDGLQSCGTPSATVP